MYTPVFPKRGGGQKRRSGYVGCRTKGCISRQDWLGASNDTCILQVADMRKREQQDEKLMYEIAQENKRMSEPLRKARQVQYPATQTRSPLPLPSNTGGCEDGCPSFRKA